MTNATSQLGPGQYGKNLFLPPAPFLVVLVFSLLDGLVPIPGKSRTEVDRENGRL
jgi:hypothetical protein